MNKAEEIEALSAFAASLPVDSYLRGWLGAVLPYIVSDITNDIFPSVTPAETAARCAELEKQGVTRVAELIEQAQRKAAGIVADAESKAESIKRGSDYWRGRFSSLVREFGKEINA